MRSSAHLVALARSLTRPLTAVRVDSILAQFGACMRSEAGKLCRERSEGRESAVRRVALASQPGRILRPGDKIDPADLRLDGDPIPYAATQLHLALNKPPGLVCSHAPDEGPSVYSLLPSEFLLRSPALEAVGRLDRIATGLLLFTQDGRLNARLCSPAAGGLKEYYVALDRPLRPGVEAAFAAGRTLLADGTVAQPARLVPHPEHAHVCTVTLGEGRHHQLRRMFAEYGHSVLAIHRVAFAGLRLETLGLAQGEWRLLSEAEVLQVLGATEGAPQPRKPHGDATPSPRGGGRSQNRGPARLRSQRRG